MTAAPTFNATPPLPPRAKGEQPPAARPPTPVGYQMGTMNEITEQLARATLSGPQRRFLEIVQRKSFGMAFIQRNQGLPHPGTSCHYERRKWAEQYDWDSSQLKRVRDELIALGVLWFVPAKPGRYQQEGEIGFCLHFDEWQPLQAPYRGEQRRKHCRRGAGCPKGHRRGPPDAGIFSSPASPFFCADGDGPLDSSTTDQGNAPFAPELIQGSVPMACEAALAAEPAALLGILGLEDAVREAETAADAAGGRCPTTASPPAFSGLDKKGGRRGNGSNTSASGTTSHPPIARAPRSPLPERRANEQLHAYWLRVLAEVQGQAKQEQFIVQACAAAMFAWPLTDAGTLNAEDCQLLGRLRHAAGAWGTVLHWIFACDREARWDVRGFLQGCGRHQHAASPAAVAPRHRGGRDGRLATTTVVPSGDGSAAGTAPDDVSSAAVPPPVIPLEVTPVERLAHALQRQLCAPGTRAGRDFQAQLGMTQAAERQLLFAEIAALLLPKGITGSAAQRLVREVCESVLVGRPGYPSAASTHQVVLQHLAERLTAYPDVAEPPTTASLRLQGEFSLDMSGGQQLAEQLALTDGDAPAFFAAAAAGMQRQGILPSLWGDRLLSMVTLAQALGEGTGALALRAAVLRHLGAALA
ncbi:MAG: hypothetical protein H0X24_03405 [Ktedonobacterales bacterium]|nr:hypothetical protein [Ktedonobacterales bacterium]